MDRRRLIFIGSRELSLQSGNVIMNEGLEACLETTGMAFDAFFSFRSIILLNQRDLLSCAKRN